MGGGDKVDLNNANIRAYLKIPGLYPNVASKIVKYGPFKTVGDVYNIPGLTSAEKEVIKKVSPRLINYLMTHLIDVLIYFYRLSPDSLF